MDIRENRRGNQEWTIPQDTGDIEQLKYNIRHRITAELDIYYITHIMS
jgi:hypothetical protein